MGQGLFLSCRACLYEKLFVLVYSREIGYVLQVRGYASEEFTCTRDALVSLTALFTWVKDASALLTRITSKS